MRRIPRPVLTLALALLTSAASSALLAQDADYTLVLPDLSVREAFRAPRPMTDLVLLTHQPPVLEAVRMEVRLPSDDVMRPQAVFPYEVLIENIGQVGVTLPWAVDPRPFGEESMGPPGYLVAMLAFDLTDDRGAMLGGLAATPLAYGSPSVSGSLLELTPGKRALLRLTGRWTPTYAGGTEVVRRVLARNQLRVQASLSLAGDLRRPVFRSTALVPVRAAL